MSGIAIYMEGGGKGSSRAFLRQGMEAFVAQLKEAARHKSRHLKVVCCGSRPETLNKFCLARRDSTNGIVLLLVDSDDPVRGAPSTHLNLDGVDDNVVHLMIEIMETWIVADDAALVDYYEQHFDARALPRGGKLESVRKKHIMDALKRATRHTKKGSYHKIRHAGDLLRRIDPQKVQGRCPSCKRLFETSNRMIAAME